MKNPNDVKEVAKHIRYEAEGQKFICTDPKQGKFFNTDLKKKRTHGYWAVRLGLGINKRPEVYCHVLLWYLHYGEIPKGQVRFIGSKDDLRIENLVCRDRLNYDKPKVEYSRIVVRKDRFDAALKLLKDHGLIEDKPKEKDNTPSEPKQKPSTKPEPSPVETSAKTLFPIDCYFLDWAYN